ncbi:MAG: DMT family transporter [Rhodobacteraceae bacterium]|nr:DMT family transporter [Paracoccaceae bacterium]
MVAFAANSVLNRLALAAGDMGPLSFATIRLISGAIMLVALVAWRDKGIQKLRRKIVFDGPLTLLLYVLGFSLAYVTLDAGVGALILFGGVQVTMFAGAVLAREAIPLNRWAGAGLAFAGLVWLMWPAGAATPEVLGAALMLAAAIGWGLYSLIGRTAKDPLLETARNFAYAVPLCALVWIVMPDDATLRGAGLAMASGMLTSGLGYALWYKVLPRLPAAVAAIAQLTVPVIAMGGGMVFLAEVPDLRFLLAAGLVSGGVILSLYRPPRNPPGKDPL